MSGLGVVLSRKSHLESIEKFVAISRGSSGSQSLDLWRDITLTQKIAEGGSRECWLHPHSDRLCVKVPKPHQRRDQNKLDWHYAQTLSRRKIQGPHLPNVHGYVMTNRGKGLVVDFIVDHDGKPSLTFFQAVRSGLFTKDQITEIIDKAFTWLNEQNVIVADYGYDNMLLQKHADGTYTLVFIDGLGGRYFNLRYLIRSRFSIPQPVRAQEFRAKIQKVIDREYGSIRL